MDVGSGIFTTRQASALIIYRCEIVCILIRFEMELSRWYQCCAEPLNDLSNNLKLSRIWKISPFPLEMFSFHDLIFEDIGDSWYTHQEMSGQKFESVFTRKPFLKIFEKCQRKLKWDRFGWFSCPYKNYSLQKFIPLKYSHYFWRRTQSSSTKELLIRENVRDKSYRSTSRVNTIEHISS